MTAAAIILAAGLSRRMAPTNKLLLSDSTGKPMITRTVDAALASRARLIYVVVGHQAEAVAVALADRPVTIVPAPDYASGLSNSLRAGLAALPPEVGAALICLGDMPLVGAADLDRLIDAYNPLLGRLIVVPTHNGQRGNPILWDRSLFPAMSTLSGDAGARSLLAINYQKITEVEMPSDGVLRDFDTLDAI